MSIDDYRVYYEHDADCRPNRLGLLKTNGTRYCYDCGGSFKADGITGVAVTSKRFDIPTTDYDLELPEPL